MLHDLGKYSNIFQKYIRGNSSFKKGQVDHSTAGAILVDSLADKNSNIQVITANLISNVIMSHHNKNGNLSFANSLLESPFSKRINKVNDTEYTKNYKSAMDNCEISIDTIKNLFYESVAEINKKSIQELFDNQYFYLSFILSCVIDADHKDTREFILGKKDYQYNYNEFFEQKLNKEESFISKFSNDSKINTVRSKLSNQCYNFATNSNGIYKLSIPTGGGKTLSSLRYALHYAKLNSNIKHIIYTIPYNTISEQTTEVIKNTIDANETDVLQATSLTKEPINNKELFKLSQQTWNSPIIVTSQVQYLNTAFAKLTTNIARFHNLIDAVIIYDEIQSLPSKCIKLNNELMNWLANNGSSIILCTATQPALEYITPSLNGLENMTRLSGDDRKVFNRVKVSKETKQSKSIKQLIKYIKEKESSNNSILVVLNTKDAVNKAYKGYHGYKKYMLSTLLCQKQRDTIFKQIYKDLELKNKILVFSTNLIEAGIDISFDCVIRSSTKLDSVIQSFGRCNRNHEKNYGECYLIKMNKEAEKTFGPLSFINVGSGITDQLENTEYGWNDYNVNKFFKSYFKKSTNMNYPVDSGYNLYELAFKYEFKVPNQTNYVNTKDVLGLLTCDIQEVRESFRVIDNITETIYLLIDEFSQSVYSKLKRLISNGVNLYEGKKYYKELAPYQVSLYGDDSHGELSKYLKEEVIRYDSITNNYVSKKSLVKI